MNRKKTRISYNSMYKTKDLRKYRNFVGMDVVMNHGKNTGNDSTCKVNQRVSHALIPKEQYKQREGPMMI